MLKVSSVKNLSNLFTPTEDVGVDLDSAILNANGGVFGVELVITSTDFRRDYMEENYTK